MEEIWSLDSNMDEIALKRLEDGTWMLKASQQGEYGEPTVFLDRKQLKDLHDAIEHELYPERYFRNKIDAISRMVWETKPKTCPFCDAELKPSRFALTGAFTDFCPQLHGKLYRVENVDKECYQWYNLVRYP